MLTKQDWIYLSGFFDGEGCIHSSTRNPGKHRYHVRLVVSQANHQFLTELYQVFKVGHINPGRKHGDKETLRWAVTKREDIKWLLEEMMPYLRLKKPQAKVALKLMNDPFNERLHVKLRTLKKKGMYERLA